MIAFDNQRVQDWATCPFFYRLRHVAGWTADRTELAPGFGSCWGRAMGAFWLSQDGPLHTVEAMNEAFLDAWREEGLPLGEELLAINPKQRTPETANRMIEAFVREQWAVKERFEWIESERSILLPLFQDGEDTIAHAGRMDHVVRRRSDGMVVVIDDKTTSLWAATGGLAYNFTASFWPSNQQLGYYWAARQLWGVRFEGILICAALVHAKHTAFDWIPLLYTEDQVEDWRLGRIEEIKSIRRAEFWPKRTQSCIGKYGSCQFHKLCSRGFTEQEIGAELPEEFTLRPWNTLERIGWREA